MRTNLCRVKIFVTNICKNIIYKLFYLFIKKKCLKHLIKNILNLHRSMYIHKVKNNSFVRHEHRTELKLEQPSNGFY